VHIATRAPTSCNFQNWRLIAAHSSEAKARLRKVAFDQAKTTDAAVTFIICGELPNYEVLPDRLAYIVSSGNMPLDERDRWVTAEVDVRRQPANIA